MNTVEKQYYEALGAALLTAAHHWVRGELDQPEPDLEEGMKVIAYLSEYQEVEISEQVQNFIKLLTKEKPDISVHFHQVADHRKWLQHSYDLWYGCLSYDCEDTNAMVDGLGHRVKIHDISKYGPYEALGYFYKFGKCVKPQSVEDDEWQKALAHHYSHNDHHPEYFKTGKSPSLCSLTESVLDMVA